MTVRGLPPHTHHFAPNALPLWVYYASVAYNTDMQVRCVIWDGAHAAFATVDADAWDDATAQATAAELCGRLRPDG